MTVPNYTVYSNHPRLLFRDTDKTDLVNRSNDAAGWKPWWDNTLIPRADSLKGLSDSSLAGNSKAHERLLVVSVAGYIEETGRPASGYKDKAIKGAAWLSGQPDNVNPTDKRRRLLALAFTFDIMFDDLTSSEKSLIGGEIIQQCDRMSLNSGEQTSGHSGNDQMCQLAGALTTHGSISGAQSRLDEALGFLYGSGPNDGRLSWARYYGSGGGSEKGGWYTFLGLWSELWTLWFMDKGTDVDPWNDATEKNWASRVWEWLVWTGWRGGVDKNFTAMGDTSKLSSSRFHDNMHYVFSILGGKYQSENGFEGGKHLLWLYDQYNAIDGDNADDQILDFVFYDKGAAASVSPENGTPAPATSTMFSPPGIYMFRGGTTATPAWDYDNEVVFEIRARKYWYLNHVHADCGSVQIRFKDDVLLQAPAGFYDSFGSDHHRNAYQRTWLQSLAPCIVDPSQVYQRYSTTIAGDGGQHFKKFGSESNPDNAFKMQNDGGGQAWLRTSEFTKVDDNAEGVFLFANIRDAYRKLHTDPQRCPILEMKYMIIKPSATNTLTYPALLYYARIKKADSSWRVVIPLHSHEPFTSTGYGLTTLGYRTTAGDGSPGKLWVDIRDKSQYTITLNGPGSPLDSNGYGPDQFKIFGSGTNWKPSTDAADVHKMDLKRHSAFWEKTTRVEEERYVGLFMPTAAADSEPVPGRAWVTDAAEPDYYGITLGSDTYLIHRTQKLAVFPAGSPDTTPPGEVSGLTLSPRDGGILANWTDPVDADLDEVKLYYRTSAS